jgi:hypothetical protein
MDDKIVAIYWSIIQNIQDDIESHEVVKVKHRLHEGIPLYIEKIAPVAILNWVLKMSNPC